jgi:hypothetical protein
MTAGSATADTRDTNMLTVVNATELTPLAAEQPCRARDNGQSAGYGSTQRDNWHA